MIHRVPLSPAMAATTTAMLTKPYFIFHIFVSESTIQERKRRKYE